MKQLVFCNCQGNIIDKEVLGSVEEMLQSKSGSQIHIKDLCGMCAKEKDEIKNIFKSEDEFIILACHERAVKMMLKYAGVDVEAQTIRFVNMREKDAETIMSEAGSFSCCAECSNMTYLESDPDWPSWYPVIDDSRCTNCGQCADFCLFGVYETIDEVVTVVNPDHCKNNCPACARICPETAIVFPKYPEGAISGSDNIDELAEQKRQQEDIQKILGSDINKSLQERKLKRQSIIKQGVMEKAIQEREQALKNKLPE